ncbi:alpha/beta hydrolase, partial [Treponema sp. OttesenSCG-928-L16]|nr:alpha/beta hydrolase [Treponema sp. OttesenSCG-928-L16]
MNESTIWADCSDGTRIFLRRWIPETAVRAVLQIVHGMAEHSLRYERLAQRLCAQGIEVWAADQRGHGRTADIRVNDPGAGGLLGHCADRDGFFKVVGDVHLINGMIRRERPDCPLFLLGHSWGSFISQAYIEQHGTELAGCALSGTKGPGELKVKLGVPFTRFMAGITGARKPSRLVQKLVNGPYSKPFKPNRTMFDWLSRDVNEVDAYAADPFCGHPCSSAFYRDMLGGLRAIHREGMIKMIPRELPVYIFCG